MKGEREHRRELDMIRLVESCDPGIVALVRRLNKANFTTVTSCSGMVTDHGWKEPEESYVAFLKDDPGKTKRIEQAAHAAGMEVDYPTYKPLWYWSSFSPCIEVRTPEKYTEDEMRHAWEAFEKHLLEP